MSSNQPVRQPAFFPEDASQDGSKSNQVIRRGSSSNWAERGRAQGPVVIRVATSESGLWLEGDVGGQRHQDGPDCTVELDAKQKVKVRHVVDEQYTAQESVQELCTR